MNSILTQVYVLCLQAIVQAAMRQAVIECSAETNVLHTTCANATTSSPDSVLMVSPSVAYSPSQHSPHTPSPTPVNQQTDALDLSPRNVKNKRTVSALIEASRLRTQHQLTYASDGSLDLSVAPKKTEQDFEDKLNIKSEGDGQKGKMAVEDRLYSPVDLSVTKEEQMKRLGLQSVIKCQSTEGVGEEKGASGKADKSVVKVDSRKGVHKCKFCPFTIGGHQAAKAIMMKHQKCHAAHKKFACIKCAFSSDTAEIMRSHAKLHVPGDRDVSKYGVPIGELLKKPRRRLAPTLAKPNKRGPKPSVKSILAAKKLAKPLSVDIKTKEQSQLSNEDETQNMDMSVTPPSEDKTNKCRPRIDKSMLNSEGADSLTSIQFSDEHNTPSPYKEESDDTPQLAPSLASIMAGGRVKNVYHCRYCPFKTASSTPAGRVNLEKHERCHHYTARYSCSVCTFSTPYFDIIKRHLLLHPETKATIVNTTKVSQKAKKRGPKVGESPGGELMGDDTTTGGTSSSTENSSDNSSDVGDNKKDSDSPDSTFKKKRAGFSESTVAGRFNMTCRFCPFKTGKNYAAKYNLERHERHHFVKGNYSCEICGYGTFEYSMMRKHKKVHMMTESDNNEIKYSDKTLNEHKPLQKPVKSPVKLEQPSQVSSSASDPNSMLCTRIELRCQYCPFKMSRISGKSTYQLEVHERCHFRKGKFNCDHCSFSTSKSHVIAKHVLWHSGEVADTTVGGRHRMKYTCSQCQYSTLDKSLFQAHRLYHKKAQHPPTGMVTREIKPDTQNALSLASSNSPKMAKATLPSPNKHLEPKAGQFVQTQSGQVPQIPADLLSMPTTNTKGRGGKKMLEIPAELWWNPIEQTYQCQWCDFSSKREHFFKVHLYCHQRKKVKFRCDICGYGATRAAFLDTHLKQHHKSPAPSTGAPLVNGTAKDLLQAVTDRMKEKGIDMPMQLLATANLVQQANFVSSPMPPPVPSPKRHSPKASPKKYQSRKRKWEMAIPDPPVPEVQVPIFLCSLCPFSTASAEIEANHNGKHCRMDKHGCPYCTYSARTRVYLEKHVRLHFTAPVQETALGNLPHNFSQEETPTVADYILQGHTEDTPNKQEQTTSQANDHCRFCDIQLQGDKLKEHESRHLIGCGYLNYVTDTMNTCSE